ncbi:hypothetical protein EIP91_007642 [Steccherinum ochraceum]|uniref:DUF6535 domain-containing protein n=1 Tax=Steccherinum ochraceum TaxID=92696 RepID=A0A4R0RE98_9APHY|nr:hypothetical protein EIP91_007642 [Steccherinum ochraceum]
MSSQSRHPHDAHPASNGQGTGQRAENAEEDLEAKQPSSDREPGRRTPSRGGHDQIWSLYNAEAATWDNSLAVRLRENTEGLLIFAGLFSATVTAFLIESYKYLLPDSGDAAATYLLQISQQIASLGNMSAPGTPAQHLPFEPTPSTIRVNILWMLSLIVSLGCALCATLVQTWASRYARLIQSPATEYAQAQRRAYLFEGMNKSRLYDWVEFLPALLHISLFLFFAGLVEFLMPINDAVGRATLGIVLVIAAAYLLATLYNLVAWNSPFRTPLSSGFYWTFVGGAQVYKHCVAFALNVVATFFPCQQASHIGHTFRRKVDSTLHKIGRDWQHRSGRTIETHYMALRWLLLRTMNVDQMVRVLEGLEAYLTSGSSPDGVQVVLRLGLRTPSLPGLGVRIGRLLQSSTPNQPMTSPFGNGEQGCADLCTRILWYIFTNTTTSQRLGGPYWTVWASRHTLLALRRLCMSPTPVSDNSAVVARCASMVILHRALTDVAHKMDIGELEIHAPSAFRVPDIVWAVGNELMWRYKKELHEIEVIRLLLPYGFEAEMVSGPAPTQVRMSNAEHGSRRVQKILVTIGESPQFSQVTPGSKLLNEGCLIGLTELLLFTNNIPGVASSDDNLDHSHFLSKTLGGIALGWSGSGTSIGSQKAFVNAVGQVTSTFNAHPSPCVLISPRKTFVKDIIRYLRPVVGTLDAPECAVRANGYLDTLANYLNTLSTSVSPASPRSPPGDLALPPRRTLFGKMSLLSGRGTDAPLPDPYVGLGSRDEEDEAKDEAQVNILQDP